MYELDNDMDELFRRAAKHYPLKTDGADWDKVLKGLEEDKDTPAIWPETRKKRKRRFLWLFLPLLLLSIGLYESSPVDNGHQQKPNTTEISFDKSESMLSTNLAGTEKAGDNSKHTLSPNPVLSGKAADNSTGTLAWSRKAIDNNNENTLSSKPSEASSMKASLMDSRIPHPLARLATPEGEMPAMLTPPAAGPLSAEKIGILVRVNRIETNGPLPAVKGAPLMVINGESADESTPKLRSPVRKFYVGVTAGPDFSSIKWQSVKNIGLNGGLLAGYQWSRLFSIESGVLWNKKYYHSKGEYLHTDDIYVPVNTKIENLTGNCRMIEWPVNLRYIFAPGRNAEWSVSMGLSSYFMKKEYYTYTYLYANGQSAEHEKVYNNASENWFSVINIGINYSLPLGRTSRLRIEPYFKAPVKGLGVGSLPIMSSGVRVDFIRKIF